MTIATTTQLAGGPVDEATPPAETGETRPLPRRYVINDFFSSFGIWNYFLSEEKPLAHGIEDWASY